MQYKISVGSKYTVTAADADCTVTDAAGRLIATVKPGAQYSFTASTSTVELSDSAAALTANFNSAPAAGGAGGVSEAALVELGLLKLSTVQVVEAIVDACPCDNGVYSSTGFSFDETLPAVDFNQISILVDATPPDDFMLRVVDKRGPRVYYSSETVQSGAMLVFKFTELHDLSFVTEVNVVKKTEPDVMIMLGYGCSSEEPQGFGFWLGPPTSGKYPVYSIETVTETPGPNIPAVDAEPTEGSALPVSSGGVFAALSQLGGGGGKFVTVQVRGVKKVEESMYGNTFTRYLTTATGWRVIDPVGPLQDWQVDCGVNCAPGWLFRELWERPSGEPESEEVNVGWEFVLLAGEEEVLLYWVRDFAAMLEAATGGVNTLHYKLIYHD